MTNEADDLTSSGLAPRPLEVSAAIGSTSNTDLVTIADLVVDLGAVITNPGEVRTGLAGVRLDSRRVQPGDLFVALPGNQVHGAQFAAQAVTNGAVAVLTDQAGARAIAQSGVTVPTLIVPNPRHAMAIASAAIYRWPANELRMLGITGTNGKTTTALMIEHALTSRDETVATIGTLGARVNGQAVPNEISTVTTPESPQLQELLARYLAAGGQWLAMEVSSHALALDRVTGCKFDVAGFTNLGQDHLDFHHTMADYFEAKARLFTPAMTSSAVLNLDDPAGVELYRRVRAAGLEVLTIGAAAQAAVRIKHWQPHLGGSLVELDFAGRDLELEVGMPGQFNVWNAATALAMLSLAGLDAAELAPSFADLQVPGRMEAVQLPELTGRRSPQVFVDFGHTPQAIAAALQAAKNSAGRLIAVFGAGGDRDPDKRQPMGAAAAEFADVVIVTDDNPRSEPPEQIRGQVIKGAADHPRASQIEIIDGADRAAAIRAALAMAEPDDRIVILGKGHEQTQEIAGHLQPFDDVSVAQQLWATLGERP